MSFNKNIILSEIFGISITDANTMINNMKIIHKGASPTSVENEYEFELRFIDGAKKDCSLETYMDTKLEDFHEIIYSDDVFITYDTHIYDTRIREMYKQTDYSRLVNGEKLDIPKSVIKKTTICSVESKRSNNMNSKQTVAPLMMKLNVENVVDESLFELTETNNYQRRQRISYTSNKPLLSNWRIDKTVRFYTYDKTNKKLLYNKLTKDNVVNPKYYDSLDIEFEYVGDYLQFEESLYKLFEVIYPNNYKVFNIKYNNLAMDIYNSYGFNLQDIFTQVGIVTNSFIQNEDINDYVYEEKYDGERVMLICSITGEQIQIFEYTKTYFKEIYSHNEGEKKDTLYILDAEKIIYENKPKYVIFDCLIYNSKNINNEIYTDRLKYVSKFVNEYNDIINMMCVNCFRLNAITEEDVYNRWRKLLHIVKTRKTSYNKDLENVRIDGLVLHKNDSNFINGKIYKLKNVLMMSVDFKLMWVPEKKVYYLYLIGNTSDLLRTTPLSNQYSKQHFGYSPMEQTKGVYMLFDTPFVQRSYEFEPDIKWYDTNESINKYMDDELRNSIDVIMARMCKNPMTYNNSIVEMTLYGNTQKWLPLRERFDKEYSNNYKVGLSNIECIYNPLSASYSNNKATDSIQNEFHYKSMLEKYFNDNTELKTLLWHTSSYDQINNIIHLTPINTLYIVSDDKLNLTKACSSVYNGCDEIIPLNNRSVIYNNSSIVDMNCIHYDNKDENFIGKIYSELLKTNFVEHSINVYIESEFENMIPDIDNYIEVLQKILSIGGYYTILSRKRLQKDNKNKLSKVFNLIVSNERIINEADGGIMYLSVFTK